MQLHNLKNIFSVLLIGLSKRIWHANGFGFLPPPYPFAPFGPNPFCPSPFLAFAPAPFAPLYPPFPPPFPGPFPGPFLPPFPPPLPYPPNFGLLSTLFQTLLAKKGKDLPSQPMIQEHVVDIHITKDHHHQKKKHHHEHWDEEKSNWD